jgi:DNA repair exonuclease SbcCD nuclease subunit
MIRLLHTADVHLGKQFPLLVNKATEYRSQLIDTFEKIVTLAVIEKVSILLIAGDLFDSKFIFGLTIGKVIAAFKKLEASGIRICIIPGSHDVYAEDSLYRFLTFPQNVTVFTPVCRQKEYADLDLTVYGLVQDSNMSTENTLKSLSLSKSSRYHIGLAHGNLKESGITENNILVLGKDEISASGLNYLALGHQHEFQDIHTSRTIACYSGSPEPIEVDRKGSGRVVLISIKGENQVEIQPVYIASKRYESMTVDISPFSSATTIEKMIAARADLNLILEVHLAGLQSLKYEMNCQKFENLLKARFFHLRVIDESHPNLDEIDFTNYPEKTVAGRYIRNMQEKISSAQNIQEKALYEESFRLGFNLLKGNLQVIE